MSSGRVELVTQLLESKKYDVITEYASVDYSKKGKLVVSEYFGKSVRAWKDDKGVTRVLCPKNMTVVQEGHVANAIANGTIFDDADEVSRNAEMVEKCTLPINGMINAGKDVPKHVKPMIAIVIGRMGEDGTFDTETGRVNGVNFVKDLCCKGNSVNDVCDNYLEKDPEEFYGRDFGPEIHALKGEVNDIRDTEYDAVVSDDDVVDSYDDYDMEELETDPEDRDKDDDDDEEKDEDKDEDEEDEESSDDESDDVEDDDDTEEVDENVLESYYESKQVVYQEGVLKTLKKLGYDPKTKTIITDIPAPNGVSGDKVRCKLKIGDLTAMQNGPCITTDDDDEPPTVHLPVTTIFGKTNKSVGVLKHEEGHLYIQMNPEKFKEDFAKADKLVDKHKHKLGGHGSVSEEYVADLYSAKTSGDKGEALIRFLKDAGIRNHRRVEKLKKDFSLKSFDKVFSKPYKLLQKLAAKRSDQPIPDDIKSAIETFKNTADDFTKCMDIDDVYSAIISRLTGNDAGYEEYMNEKRKLRESKNITDIKPKYNEIKKNIKIVKECIYAFADTIKSEIPDWETLRRKYAALSRKICAGLDAFVAKTDNEIRLRIAFIRHNVNESYVDNRSAYDEFTQEGFLSKKPKKLKPIPRDVVAYITVEMNAIHSSNDQAMLAGYTCSKIELVDFYLTCIDTQDARYIVPHNKQYLEQMKKDLENLLAQILRIRPINRTEQIWRVNYPTT